MGEMRSVKRSLEKQEIYVEEEEKPARTEYLNKKGDNALFEKSKFLFYFFIYF